MVRASAFHVEDCGSIPYFRSNVWLTERLGAGLQNQLSGFDFRTILKLYRGGIGRR